MDPLTEFSRSGTDGTFWMVWEDFEDNFNELFVARILPESFHQYDVRGEWSLGTAAGAPLKMLHEKSTLSALTTLKEPRKWISKADSEPDWFRNPQYRLSVSTPTDILVSLTQRDAKLYGGDNFSINFLVLRQPKQMKSVEWQVHYDAIVGEAHSLDENNVVSDAEDGTTSLVIAPEREISKGNIRLEPHFAYIVVPYTSSAKIHMEFFLRIFASNALVLNVLASPHQTTLAGKWQKEGERSSAGGPLRMGLTSGAENASWCQNPQYWIQLQAPTQVSTSINITVRKTGKSTGLKSPNKAKEASKNRSQSIGLTVLKPTLVVNTKKKAGGKTNFLGEPTEDKVSKGSSPTRRASLTMDLESNTAAPDRRLVVSSEEWCRMSDYSTTSTACIFLPNLSREWAPGGLIVVPTLGEAGVEGTYEIECHSSVPISVTELVCSTTQTLEGSWSSSLDNAGGCHLNTEWKKNPRVILSLQSGKPVRVSITLSRSETEWKGKCKRNCVGTMMGFYLFQGLKGDHGDAGGTVQGKHWGETDFVPMHTVSSPRNLLLGPLFNECYVIMPTIWEPNQYGSYLLSVTADCPFTLSHNYT